MTTVVEPPRPSPEEEAAASPEAPAAPFTEVAYRVDIPGVSSDDLRPVKWQLYLSLTGLALGAAMGILQALERLNLDLYDEVQLESYYQGLTLHGVALALVFTFAFANAFLPLLMMRGLGRPMASRRLADASLALAWSGVALALWAILVNKASVLFTFYAPMQATPAFYIGAVLLVVSTWVTLLNQALTLRAWRQDRAPGERRIPLLAYVSIVTNVMWFLASLGIAIEVLGFLLPWSLGLWDTVDPQFTRVLFWFSGHPIVYYWLLPIYASWYLLLPKQVGGRIWSDGLTRIVFLSFLILLPVGVHHQFTDPGIPTSSKTIQWILTFAIFYPSLVTAFSVFAALESGGKARGGRGLFSWIFKLPWGDPAVSGQLLAGLCFMLGGASGIINASYAMNLEVHNTAFVPGHFHLTVGTGVALSIMAISYWLVPYLTGRALAHRRIAVAQGWLWAIGVVLFSRGQMMGGLEGMPRRTLINAAPYTDDNPWDMANTFTGIGGMLMFTSAVLFFFVIFRTVHNRRGVGALMQRIPVAEVKHGAERAWGILDQLWVWAAAAIILSVLVYGEVVLHYWPINDVSEGFVLW